MNVLVRRMRVHTRVREEPRRSGDANECAAKVTTGTLHDWRHVIPSDACSDSGSKGQIRNLRLGQRLFVITSSKRDRFKRTLLAKTMHCVVSQSRSKETLKLQSAVALLDCGRELFGGRRAAEVYSC